MKKRELPYSHPIAVATLHGETRLKLEPDADARVRIARYLGLHAVDRFRVEMTLVHAANGLVSVEGQLDAKIHPICVVSLDPFEQKISEPVAIRFAPDALIERMTKRAAENNEDEFEAPDPIQDGVIDFGMVAVEFLALALDPYPRKPDAEFTGGDPEPEVLSPFAALKTLKSPKVD